MRLLRDDAFHITSAVNIVSIAATGFRTDRCGVLGTGAYFDLGSDASGWAPARQRYPGESLIVFRCEIDLGNLLDLDDPAVRDQFRQFQRALVRRVGREQTLRLGQGGHVDLFIEALATAGETRDTVKRTFSTDGVSRVAVRDPRRIRVLSVHDEHGRTLKWPPPGS